MRKMSRLGRIVSAMAMLMPMFGAGAHAALPEVGKAYQIINKSYGTALTANGPSAAVSCGEPSATQQSQQWLVSTGASNGTYYLRSLNTGMYLCSPDQASSGWYLSATPTSAASLTISEGDGGLTIRKSGSGNVAGYLHCDQSNTAVCWSTDAPSSWWEPSALSLTTAEINAALTRAEQNAAEANNQATYQAALDKLFADKACTKLNSSYASMSSSQLAADANYKALAPELQAMVQKVKSGNWAETDIKTGKQWDSEHARKFRVQSYEPYSRAVEVQPLTGIQYYTNMNNPTGITTVSYKTLYVMVDKAPADGSTIYLNGAVGYGMFNDWNAGTPLHEGLNVVPVWSDDALQYIYYTVDTYSDGRRKHKLTEYPDVKIHIEGGSLNGFYNYLGDELYTPDTNDDWYYYSERATHPMFDLVGRHVILHFFLDKIERNPAEGVNTLDKGLRQILVKSDSRVDLPKIMKAWDDMCLSEHLIMGLRSREDVLSPEAQGYYEPLEDGDVAPNDLYLYFNNRMMGITMQGNLFMNATNWRTAYATYTAEDILLNFRTNSGTLWGPAHEYGHMNQGPMKLIGTTEISNNVFSNVAVYYQGLTTSRAAYPADQLEVFNKNGIFLDHGLWGATRMFFQLWLYYHQTGANRKFYPTLYQLLREQPLQHSYEYNERTDKLHFAKMCCIAAGEDLTDFFESWGFFVPIERLVVEDYSTNIATLPQADIDAVKAEIAALKLPKNRAIINIDDRPGSDRESYSEWDKNGAGKLGGLKDFAAGVKPDAGLLYSVAGNKITVSGGNGGVGFVGYDSNGKLVTFSNDYEWNLRDDAALYMATGRGKLYAVAADGSLTVVKNAATDGSAAQKAEAAANVIAVVKAMLERVDATETRVGAYRPSHVVELTSLLAQAEEIVNSDPAKAYSMLVNEYYDVLTDAYARVTIVPGSTYIIRNRQYADRVLVGGPASAMQIPADKSLDAQPWTFIEAGDGKFYLYSAKMGKYLGTVKKNEEPAMVAVPESRFEVAEVADGYYGVSAESVDGGSIHITTAGKVVGWYTDAEASQWIITAAGDNARNSALLNLRELLDKTSALLATAGDIKVSGNKPVGVTADSFSSNAPCQVAGEDKFTSFATLLDGKNETWFASDYSEAGSTDGGEHYLQVDLGSTSTDQLRFTYNTRKAGVVLAPKTMTVFGSTDGKVWIPVAYLYENLPSAGATRYPSPGIHTAEPYRYYRFTVNSTYDGLTAPDGHQYFAMSQFGVYTCTISAEPSSNYPELTAAVLLDANRYYTLGDAAMRYSESSVEELEAVYEDLLPRYEALVEAMKVQSGLESIEAAAAGDGAVYDLQGRRLRSVSAPGLYIIGGRKVLVK